MAPVDRPGEDEVLIEVLARAQELGFIGPGPLDEQVEHGRAFAAAVDRGWGTAAGPDAPPRPRRVVDLGSGGGLPALVIARSRSGVTFTLVEAQHRRAQFLEEAVARLALGASVEVALERAEVFGRDPEHRGAYDVATARAFGPPAVVAECAAPLLASGGVLVVSEPPGVADGVRWPDEGLALLGMGSAAVLDAEGRRFAVIPQRRPCPDRYPRRVGIPAKRPLF
jgi:16S rRNA (guanine527-N7)-methyltransferase